ncbi:hypothetical protein HAZT_HAZT005942 [Hyalella azteca]|uniref:Uncharacterized protein n=1 Tax=Hyalella azteca TaxID=294128 RepID=A0A6A0GRI7_HYAAZ|nr:hypothetical protein HAZT_HAZT005942 [Hyalella azteca]
MFIVYCFVAGVMSIAKPQLRGLLASHIKRNIAISTFASIAAAAGYYYGVAKPRKQKYAEFYKNYDEAKSFERQRKTGLFQACPLEDED